MCGEAARNGKAGGMRMLIGVTDKKGVKCLFRRRIFRNNIGNLRRGNGSNMNFFVFFCRNHTHIHFKADNSGQYIPDHIAVFGHDDVTMKRRIHQEHGAIVFIFDGTDRTDPQIHGGLRNGMGKFFHCFFPDVSEFLHFDSSSALQGY